MILIEGLPGCGKTTMASRLCSFLGRSGIEAEWWREEDAEHPITPRALKQSAARPGFAERCLEAWREGVATSEREQRIHVLEGTVFQSTLRFMLEYGMARTLILAYVVRLDEVLAPGAPALVYLHAADPASFLLERVLPDRGEPWISKVSAYLEGTPFCRSRGWAGQRGMVYFWLHYRELCDEALDRLTLPVHRVGVGEDRFADAERSVCAWSRAHLGAETGSSGSGGLEPGQGLDVRSEGEEGPGFERRET